jgi:CDP-glycerol glycerophosphotransferase
MPALQSEFDAEASVHPRNRKDKRPTVERLVEADYVISDFGTLVYEAWALGKPVLFPRWILGDRVQQYLPASAEAHILAERIGYHPDSFDEMMDMLRSGPVITPDVDRFMDEYLDNYRGGDSAAEVVRALRRLAGDASNA